jgi:HK97 family phage prohead protease
VARTRSLTQTEKGLSAVAEFPPKGVFPLADTVYELVKGGFLNACSVGFRADKWSYNEERGGVDFLEQQLLEWSICPVPANPQALIEARAAGIDTTLVKDWAEAVLKAETPAAPVVEPVVPVEPDLAVQ